MFDGFESCSVALTRTSIFMRRKGSGPPVLLLHGFPETHHMWHRVAPELARHFTVVCADLRGYGQSGKPFSPPDHSAYAKSAMALDMIELMEAQGFPRFSVVGHDRGGRVAYRMALDHPEGIERLAVLDLIPTGEVFRRAEAQLLLSFWPWSLLAQPPPLPERLILGDPESVVDDALGGWGSERGSFPAEVRAAYVNALRDPETVHAICEEYRAAATLDVQMDERDLAAGRKIACPVLALWSRGGGLDRWYENAGGPLGIWSTWAHRVQGAAISGGHFFPEQNSLDTISALLAFLRAP